MARKKTTSQKSNQPAKVTKSKPEKAPERQSTPSYVNLIYGAVTVVVLFLLAFFAVKTFTTHKTGEITQEAAMDSTQEHTYTIKKGDTLWSIAESQMGSGFEWKKLAEANEIKDQTQLKAGSQLIIPQRQIESKNLDEITASPSVTAEPSGIVPSQEPTTISPQPNLPADQPSIQGNAYVVVAGDTLWDIAIRAYGDGYRWVDIARANNLSNPDLIFSGNKFVLPR